MGKKGLYLVAGIWFACVVPALWLGSLTTEWVAAVISICLGVWVIINDPRTAESKKLGHRIIGLVLLASGSIRLAFLMYLRLFI